MNFLVLSAMAASAVGAPPEGWMYYGGDAEGTKYSSADQINLSNVAELVPAWTYRTGHMTAPPEAVRRSKFEATPILAEGKLLLCTPFNVVIALDPSTGHEIWRHDAAPDLTQKPANAFNCRGVTYWRDVLADRGAHCSSRVFMGTNDHRLIAVDLADGKKCEEFGTSGVVSIEPEPMLTSPGEYQITSPPVVLGNVVVVGSSISDNNRVGAPRGTVHAFNAETGTPLWKFDPLIRTARDGDASLGGPGNEAGQANVWAPMSADAARGLIYMPTSSPSPDFFGGYRPGDNRYANSVVAVEAATGSVRWSFQTVHHDVWDYDVPAQPLLATVSKDGVKRDVVIQVTKTGFVFVLDRDSGEPIFDVEERAVPQGGATGEILSPTQPFPLKPRSLSASKIEPDDAYGLLPLDKEDCRKQIAAARREGLFTPPSTQGTIVFPFTGGGANWGGGSFDPVTNRLFVNTSSAAHLITLVPRADTDEKWHNVKDGEQAPMLGAPFAVRRQTMLGSLGLPCNPPPWGLVHAIDMTTGNIVWESILGTTEEVAPLGLALKTGTPNLGGSLVTAGGLLFIGAAMDSYLRAFNASTGEEIWQGKLPAGGQATPMTYEWAGRQYVVISAGGHSEASTKLGDYVVAYALPREGESGPTLASRLIDRPGGRFRLTLTLFAAAFVSLLLIVMRFFKWRRKRRTAAR